MLFAHWWNVEFFTGIQSFFFLIIRCNQFYRWGGFSLRAYSFLSLMHRFTYGFFCSWNIPFEIQTALIIENDTTLALTDSCQHRMKKKNNTKLSDELLSSKRGFYVRRTKCQWPCFYCKWRQMKEHLFPHYSDQEHTRPLTGSKSIECPKI